MDEILDRAINALEKMRGGYTHEDGYPIGHVGWLLKMADKWPDKTEADALRCHAGTTEFRETEWLALRDYLGIPMHVRVDDWIEEIENEQY